MSEVIFGEIHMAEYRSMAKYAQMLGKSLMDKPDFPSLLQINRNSRPVRTQHLRDRPLAIFLSLLCFSITLGIILYPAISTEITIIGKVNYFYQIMANGQIYEVANTTMGDQLVINHIAEKVEVTGIVKKKGERKIITVKSYRVVTEVNPYSH